MMTCSIWSSERSVRSGDASAFCIEPGTSDSPAAVDAAPRRVRRVMPWDGSLDTPNSSSGSFPASGVLARVRLVLQGFSGWRCITSVSYTHLRAHETDSYLVCRLLLEKKKKENLSTKT